MRRIARIEREIDRWRAQAIDLQRSGQKLLWRVKISRDCPVSSHLDCAQFVNLARTHQQTDRFQDLFRRRGKDCFGRHATRALPDNVNGLDRTRWASWTRSACGCAHTCTGLVAEQKDD